MKIFVKNILSDFLELSNLRDQKIKDAEKIKDLEERILNCETKLIEISRAVATIALAHASLLRELGQISDAIEKKKKSQQTRKTEDDFTN